MTREELVQTRKAIGMNQAEMADLLALSKRAYAAIETGEATFRNIHQLAFERILIMHCARIGDATLLAPTLRAEIAALASAMKASEDRPSSPS